MDLILTFTISYELFIFSLFATVPQWGLKLFFSIRYQENWNKSEFKINVNETSLNTSGSYEKLFYVVLRIQIRDPVPFWPLELGYGMGKYQNPDQDTGLTTRIIFPRAAGIRDGKTSDPVSGINIPDTQHCLIISK
jgi:hypothetical protein